MVFVVIGLGVVLVAALAALLRVALSAKAERARFASIVDIDAEVVRLRTNAQQEVTQLRASADADMTQRKAAALDEVARLKSDAQRDRQMAYDATKAAEIEAAQLKAAAEHDVERLARTIKLQQAQCAQIGDETAKAKFEFERLGDELRKIEGNLEDISFGLYKPHFNFETPEQFKREMERVFDKQKEMIRAGTAASFLVSWTVGDSKREGERMQKQYSKLLLRAFNGECDASIAKVTWNNASKMEERIKRAFDAINQLGQVMTVSLATAYRDLKLAELRLEHELAEKKREIADEQRRIREQMKDEQRAIQDAERAQADAEAEEVRFQKALDRAKLELGKARGEEHARLNEKILDLQSQLTDAKARAVRAKSLAEMTKAGYVYVISNIGSFGDRVFKIGMTRRLEPMDRVRELGAASVPFPFDVHAMVYSDDAPGLETAFHQRFKERSLNLVNTRKEFFGVGIDELEAFAKERGLAMSFTRLAEAREYRESAAMRLAKGSGPTTTRDGHPDNLAVNLALTKHSHRPSAHESVGTAVPKI